LKGQVPEADRLERSFFSMVMAPYHIMVRGKMMHT
jgi:hypothetical protein